MWNRVVLCGTRFKLTFMKFDKSWNVLQSSKYYSMISKSLMDCLNVQTNFSEVWQVLECLGSLEIFFYDFQKSHGLLEAPKLLFWSLTSLGMSWKLQNIVLWFLKVSWITRRSKIIFLKFDKSWNVLEASKYFSMIFKCLLDY